MGQTYYDDFITPVFKNRRLVLIISLNCHKIMEN